VNQAASVQAPQFKFERNRAPVPSNPIIILKTPTILLTLPQDNRWKTFGHKNPPMDEVQQPYYARTGKAHPSLTGKLEVYQLYRAQFPPTATARDRDLTAGGPLSTDIGHRRGAPAAAPRRRTLPLRPSPSPAAGDAVGPCARRRRLRPPRLRSWCGACCRGLRCCAGEEDLVWPLIWRLVFGLVCALLVGYLNPHMVRRRRLYMRLPSAIRP